MYLVVRERRARRALSGMLRLGLGVGTMVSGESSILEFWGSGICWLVWLLMMLYRKVIVTVPLYMASL